MNEAERAAFAEHPELRWLAALRDRGGWRFTHHHGVAATGIRTWPDGTTDALVIRGPGEACGQRTDPGGRAVWTRGGTLAEVVAGLLELSPPGQRLWTP